MKEESCLDLPDWEWREELGGEGEVAETGKEDEAGEDEKEAVEAWARSSVRWVVPGRQREEWVGWRREGREAVSTDLPLTAVLTPPRCLSIPD